jgi:hypothetical protein
MGRDHAVPGDGAALRRNAGGSLRAGCRWPGAGRGESIADALAMRTSTESCIGISPGNIMLTEHGVSCSISGLPSGWRPRAIGGDGPTVNGGGHDRGLGARVRAGGGARDGSSVRRVQLRVGAVRDGDGQRAFQGDTHMSTLAAVLQRSPRRCGTWRWRPGADRIVRRCLRKVRRSDTGHGRPPAPR